VRAELTPYATSAALQSPSPVREFRITKRTGASGRRCAPRVFMRAPIGSVILPMWVLEVRRRRHFAEVGGPLALDSVHLLRGPRYLRRHSASGCTWFIVAQLLGAAAATALFRWLVPALPSSAPSVVLPHEERT
jgi:hypothetical protein